MQAVHHMIPNSAKVFAVLISVLALVLMPAGVFATGSGNAPEKWPAWYAGSEVTIMMGPSGNSQNPNQLPGGCFGLGPDFASNKDLASMSVMYILPIPGATQMSCPDGHTSMHDMVLTVAPGDLAYSPFAAIVRCKANPNSITPPAMPYTSAADVEIAWSAGILACGAPSGAVRLSPVVGGSG
jgi:hypothetical protein